MGFEAKIIIFLQAGSNTFFDVFFRLFSILGSFLGFLIVFLLAIKFTNKRFCTVFALTYILGVLGNYILKHIISRPRPFEVYESISDFTSANGSSMPSGHAVSASIIAIFACFMVIKLAKNKFTKFASIITACLYVGVVCLSRMYLGVHFLTDVLVGVTLGSLISFIGVLILLRKPKENM